MRRDNYKEFAELCTLFLDGDENDSIVTFKRPGALHKARWMAKLVYSIKICLLNKYISQLSGGPITNPQQVVKVREFVNFATLLYSEWWMACSSAVDAPWHDLQLVHNLLKYKSQCCGECTACFQTASVVLNSRNDTACTIQQCCADA